MTFNISIIEIKEGDQTYYRDNHWCLYAFKFCNGGGMPGYVPTWFALNPKDWSQQIDIFYQPTYSVFYNKLIEISDDTVIRTSTKTLAIPLGSKVTLNENNRLEVTEEGYGSGAIVVTNNSASGRALLGLTGPSEAHVDTNAPFAVFDVAKGNILTMQPIEKVLIFIASLNVQQGIIRSNTFAPGLLIDLTKFSAADRPQINLLLNRDNNGLVAADSKSSQSLTEVSSQTALTVLGPK